MMSRMKFDGAAVGAEGAFAAASIGGLDGFMLNFHSITRGRVSALERDLGSLGLNPGIESLSD